MPFFVYFGVGVVGGGGDGGGGGAAAAVSRHIRCPHFSTESATLASRSKSFQKERDEPVSWADRQTDRQTEMNHFQRRNEPVPERERKRERQTDTETDRWAISMGEMSQFRRERDRQTDRQTDRERQR